MALVELLLPPSPEHVRTARLVAAAAARRAGLADELVDELRLALGEACGRAVLLHARHAPDVRVEVTVRDDPAGLTVAVRDRGPAAGPVADDAPGALEDAFSDVSDVGGADGESGLADPDVALAVLRGLVDDVSIEPDPEGTTVTMRWPLATRVSGLPSTAAVQT